MLIPLAAVLGLSGADQATVGASATQISAALHLHHAGVGVLAAASGVVSAVAAVPFGVLVDRVNRTRMLSAGVAAWAVVMAASAAAGSFMELVVARCILGAAVAVGAPAVASLVGDYFPSSERGRIWGAVITGELVGTGVGFAVSGALASVSWRASFLVLAPPALALAFFLRRLPEPDRGGTVAAVVGEDQTDTLSEAQQAVQDAGVRPYDELVITDDPAHWGLLRAARYVLRVRTNAVLIVVGACGYFFFGGVRAFGVEFVKHQYGISQGFASSLALILGVFAIGGAIAGGWLSDHFGRGRDLRGRIYLAAAGLTGAAVLFVPALTVTSVAGGIPALGAAALCLASINPPVDAGRLDIMHPLLWGRAEAVRTLVKQPAEALAPLLFGVVADHVGHGGASGLRTTFLIMLAPLGVSIVILMRARSTYPRDVATAVASVKSNPQPASLTPAQ
ncbi:MAG TPA: MFS transporter [Mycobacteriales bacterium]|nr:MFS transporter [Mycobacteriales bacterium]